MMDLEVIELVPFEAAPPPDFRCRDRLDWYKRQEFKVNKIARREQEERAKQRGISLDELPVSMRLDLFSLLEDLQDAYPADFPRT